MILGLFKYTAILMYLIIFCAMNVIILQIYIYIYIDKYIFI